MAEDRAGGALEKLNQGIEESKQMVQQQTMKLAQEFFSDSVESLKQQIQENRETLEKLPDQIPGGQEEPFQALFQELMDNYAAVESCLDEAQNNVSNLDIENLREQGEIDATDAARREARELGVDLTRVEGTGTGGRIIISDVLEAVEESGGASDSVRRKAEELGVDLSQIEGSGTNGLITLEDVTSRAGDAVQDATGAAEQVAGKATEKVEQAAAEADGVVEQATDEAGQVAGEKNGDEGPKATNAARRKAEELGLDLSQIQGSGAGGLITVRDVMKS